MTRTPRSFVVYGTPQPQGSAKAFVVGGKARITTDNAKLKPWRQQVALTALSEKLEKFGKHVPVVLWVAFYLDKPPSVPRKRILPAVKPDLDKLVRAVNDALTGICWEDDGQVVSVAASKMYGSPARTEIRVAVLDDVIAVLA